MPALYTESDADSSTLEGRKVAVLGYGDEGRAVALNIRDSGFMPIIGEANEVRAGQARADGFEPVYPSNAAFAADIKLMALPDEALPEVYLAHVSPSLKEGDMLVFPTGYTIAFGYVEPPPFVDAVMIAPRLVGRDLRELYLRGQGALSFVTVAQDFSGKAWDRLLAVAKAMGALRAGAMEVTFQQETELDLFMQQAVLPALHHLLLTAADILVKEGYPSEAALLDLYMSGELGHHLARNAEQGMMTALRAISLTGQYGILSRAERFQDPRLRRQMEMVLEDIRSGKFAQEWTAEYHNGYPRLDALRTKRGSLALWQLEQQTLDMVRQIAAQRGERSEE